MKQLRNILVAIVILVSMLIVLGYSTDVFACELEVHTGYIYLGDSRFVGMNKVVHMDEEEHTFVVAKTGQGLRWLKKTAYDEIIDIMDNNTNVDEWIIISGLGINDGYQGDKYVEFYKTFPEDVRLIVLSVNPLDKNKCDKYGYDFEGLNDGACKVNNALRESDLEYLDTRRELIMLGYETQDGVHYTNDTYEMIYDIIQGYLSEGD